MGATVKQKARIMFVSDTGFTVGLCELVVDPSLPWLGVSPDAIVIDPLEPSVGLLEIKCPFTHCLSTVEDAASDFSFFTEISNGKVILKKDYKHYYQVQEQMSLTKVPWCDFIIYTLGIIAYKGSDLNQNFGTVLRLI